MIEKYLEDLDRRIDDAVEERLFAEWVGFVEGRFDGGLFEPRRSKAAPPGVSWPKVGVNEGIGDFELMALQQFRDCSAQLEAGSGKLLCVRTNYGSSILASLFGARLFMMSDETDTLPTTWPLTLDEIKAVADGGVPDVRGGLGGRVLEMGERFQAIRRQYPAIGRRVFVYHPDLQGAMDICEVLWGSRLFLDLVDRPELVKALLAVITETYIRFLREWSRIVPFSAEDREVHWGMLHRGHIMLRDDSAMNLSPAMVAEFVLPHDQRLLNEFGGGAVHFCGRGDHYIDRLCRLRGMHAIAMSQPEYNDMERIYRHTVDRGISLIGFSRERARADLARGRDVHGRVQSW